MLCRAYMKIDSGTSCGVCRLLCKLLLHSFSKRSYSVSSIG